MSVDPTKVIVELKIIESALDGQQATWSKHKGVSKVECGIMDIRLTIGLLYTCQGNWQMIVKSIMDRKMTLEKLKYGFTPRLKSKKQAAESLERQTKAVHAWVRLIRLLSAIKR